VCRCSCANLVAGTPLRKYIDLSRWEIADAAVRYWRQIIYKPWSARRRHRHSYAEQITIFVFIRRIETRVPSSICRGAARARVCARVCARLNCRIFP
jgi:hypothetical protein